MSDARDWNGEDLTNTDALPRGDLEGNVAQDLRPILSEVERFVVKYEEFKNVTLLESSGPRDS